MKIEAFTKPALRSDTIVSDAGFDALARLIRPRMATGNELLDAFFRREFAPHTGHWVHKHPDLAGLDRVYRALTAEPPRADGCEFPMHDWVPGSFYATVRRDVGNCIRAESAKLKGNDNG